MSDLARAGLGLRLLTAPDRALDRPVTGTTTIDLREPGRYVAVGHLVLTGLAWRRGAADSEAFVASVDAAGGCALAVGEGLLGRVPDDVVRAARRLGLPVFAVPADVAFHRVSAHVDAALGAGGDVAQRLLAGAAAGRPLPELADGLGGVRVLSPTGRVLAGPRLEEDELDALFATGAPGRRVGPGPDGWWLVPGADPAEALLTAFAGIVALHRQVPQPVAAPAGEVVAVAVDDPALLGLVADAVGDLPHEVVHEAGREPAGGGGAAHVLAQAAALEVLEHRLRRTAAVLDGRRLVVGVSRPGGDRDDALAGARRALRTARALDGPVVVEHDRDTGDVLDLLRAVPLPQRREFARGVLAGVLEDEELLTTLRTHLAGGSSPTRTASALHVHQNTVRYRLSRVEALLGRDLRDVDDLVDLRVALRLLDG
ncbi:helix-turn-helix domain-containing protein [Kineococcus sp. SYSU DK006]|uniref:PucR family transcriptional regulator n=1 Tax=Kineococcus sp. SYSU DK006 TaxID=3383127 RepID=UPI003D7CBACA